MTKKFTVSLAGLAVFATFVLGAAKPPTADETARMEQAAPSKATVKPRRPRKILIVSQCEGFTHSSVPIAEVALQIMARKTGAFEAVVVHDFSILEKAEFDSFDAIVMNNSTARLPLLAIDTSGMNAAQKAEAEAREARAQKRFLDFIRNGKGLVGIHAATDCLYKWPEYGELMGGYFSGHPWNESVRVKLDDPGHPILAAFNGQDFDVADEIYQFRDPYSRKTLRVLMSLDVKKTNMEKKGIKRTDKDFGVAWIREYGKGRAFFFSLGHRHEIFWNVPVMQCYLDGIQYALGDLKADATPSAELPEAYLEFSRARSLVSGLQSIMRELAAYKLEQGKRVPEQVADMVVQYQDGSNHTACNKLSDGLAAVVADSSATFDGRAFACRQLAVIGTDGAVPQLAALLGDRQLCEWARHALAGIPGAAADKALLDSLSRVSGDAKVAVAALLGKRRVVAAVTPLATALRDPSPVGPAAAEALGRIATDAALEALARSQASVEGAARSAVDRALLSCGETARLAGKDALAAKAYGYLGATGTAAHVRAAAFYGSLILNASAGDVVKALREGDIEMARAAARVVHEPTSQPVAAAVAKALPSLPPASQVLVLDALAAREYRSAQAAVLKMLDAKDAGVRLAALRALTSLGDASAVATAVRMAASEDLDKTERNAAREMLNLMKGPGVDEAIARLMHESEAAAKIEYVKVLGVRKAKPAMPALLKAALAADESLAREARKAIGMLAAPEHLPLLVGLLIDSDGASAWGKTETIIAAVAQSAEDDSVKTAAILSGLKRDISSGARGALLSALAKIGSPTGLKALTGALAHADATVRRAAIRGLGERWPNASPIQALRSASLKDGDEGNRILALRGYARMLAMPSKRPMRETLSLYSEALKLAKGPQEKRALISGLGRLAHPEALDFVRPFLGDAAVQTEALVAAVAITEGLSGKSMVLTGSSGQGTERNAVDGSDKTRWTTGSAMVGGEWFKIDLGYETEIREIFLDAGPTGHDQPRGYKVYVSPDGEQWGEPVVEGGDPKQKAFTITLPATPGRFVKIVQTGQHGLYWSINEMRVNGMPDHTGNVPLDRSKWKVSASRSPAAEGPEHAIDGDLSKRWGTSTAMKPDDWFMVDLGEVKTVCGVVMDAARSGNDYPREYRVYTSLDGKQWVGPIGAGKGSQARTTATLLPTRTRYVKIAQVGSHHTNWWSMYDLQILGK